MNFRNILTALLLYFVSQTISAATYSIPSGIGSGAFSSCSGSGPSYNCGDITLNDNDIVNVTSDVTLNMTDYKFDIKENVTIDDGGNSFVINTKDLTIGVGSTIDATIYASSSVDIKENVTVNGSVYADSLNINSGSVINGECPPHDYSVCTGLPPMLDHFAFDFTTAVSASVCSDFTFTITAEDSSNATYTDYDGTVTIASTTNHGDFTKVTATNNTNPVSDTDDNGSIGYTFSTSDNGVITFKLTDTHAETTTITVTDSTVPVTSTSVNITFSENAFVITDIDDTLLGDDGTVTGTDNIARTSDDSNIPIAGRNHSYLIEMIRKDPSTGACGTATNYTGSKPLNLSRTIVSSAPGNSPTLAGYNLGTSATGGENITFSAGEATVTLATSDIGKFTIDIADVSTTFSSSTISGTSSTQTVRPFGLSISNITGANALTGITDPTDPNEATVFATAGADFAVTVQGVLYSSSDDVDNNGEIDSGRLYSDNAKAPNFAWETILDTVTGGFTPAGDTSDLLRGISQTVIVSQAELETSGNPSVGSFDLTDLRYAEVGSFTLQADSVDFLGTNGVDISSDQVVIGRFIPAAFVLSSKTDGILADTCSSFTYLGETFDYLTAPSFEVTANNAQGDPTENYTGAWAKLQASSFTVDSVSTDATNTGSDGSLLSIAFEAANFTTPSDNGDGTFDINFGDEQFCYGTDDAAPGLNCSKDSNSLVGEFTADIKRTISQISDGEVTSSVTSLEGEISSFGNTQKYGRLTISNSFGSDLIPQQVTIKTEIYDSTLGQFITHTSDNSCTTYDASSNVNLASGSYSATSSTLPLTAATIAASGSGTLIDGVGSFTIHDDTIATNGPNAFGTVTYDATVGNHLMYDWNGDNSHDNLPSAKATFGIYEGSSKMIYYRQIYQ